MLRKESREILATCRAHVTEAEKNVKVASKVIGTQMNSLDNIYKRQVLNKALSIRSDAAHPLYVEYNLLPSGVRLRAPCASKNRYKFSFVPVSIGTLNAVGGRSGR